MSQSKNAVYVIHESESRRKWRRVSVHWTLKRRYFFDRKYLIDLYVGRFLLVVFSPAILLLWATVKLTSRGPGFYRQTRVGLNGHEFELFKLRSMRMDAEKSGQAIWCSKNDSRMTWLGKILRKLHLDELPQLLNVARGEMSLVGPRPERPMICEELAEEIDGYYDRVIVKPGITGLSQINLPADSSLADVRRKQVLDLQYINETTLWFELRILFATALRIVGIKGAIAMRSVRLCRLSLLDELEIRPGSQPAPTIRKKPKRRQRVVHDVHPEPASVYSLAYESDSSIELLLDSTDTSSSSGIGLPR